MDLFQNDLFCLRGAHTNAFKCHLTRPDPTLLLQTIFELNAVRPVSAVYETMTAIDNCLSNETTNLCDVWCAERISYNENEQKASPRQLPHTGVTPLPAVGIAGHFDGIDWNCFTFPMTADLSKRNFCASRAAAKQIKAKRN